jgi:hypothetical protein
MINNVLLFLTFIIHSQAILLTETKSCEVCIVNSVCTDDTMNFNISISEYCRNPLTTYFTYYTDTNLKPRPYNTTATCINCNINIPIDSVQGAWDYTLTLESPEPSKTCSTRHTAHCGGSMSQIIWFITGGLSGLFIVLGLLLCCLKYRFCRRKQMKMKKKKMVIAVINT